MSTPRPRLLPTILLLPALCASLPVWADCPPSGCPSGQSCVLLANQTYGCAVPTTADRIRTEAMKPSTDADRPLPLASLWCSGPGPAYNDEVNETYDNSYYFEEGRINGQVADYDLAYQLQQIDNGNYLLPVVDASLPYGNNGGVGDFLWGYEPQSCGPACEALMFESKMSGPMSQLSSLGLPFTISHLQLEDMIGKLTQPWVANSSPDMKATYHCPLIPGRGGDHDGCFVTPFGPESVFTKLGQEFAKTGMLQKYAQWFKSPPMVLFLSNNEAPLDWNWMDAYADPSRTISLTGGQANVDFSAGIDPNTNSKQAVDGAWVARIQAMTAAIAASLPNLGGATWGATSVLKRFVAYTSRPLSHQDEAAYTYLLSRALNTYQPCCTAENLGACRAALDDGSLLCFRKTAPANPADMVNGGAYRMPREPAKLATGRCLGTDSSTDLQVICQREVSHARADVQPQIDQLTSPNLTAAERARAFHFMNDAWPEGDPTKRVDRTFRAWDGTSMVGGVASGETRDFINGRYLFASGFSPLIQEGQTIPLADRSWHETYAVTASDNLPADIWNLVIQKNCPNGTQNNACANENPHAHAEGIAAVEALYPQFGPSLATATSEVPVGYYGTQRSRGLSQLFLWMYRPRVSRTFDACFGGGVSRDYTERFVRGTFEAVNNVWNDPRLTDFWRSSVLVENAAVTEKIRAVADAIDPRWGTPSKYWFLRTSSEDNYPKDRRRAPVTVGNTTWPAEKSYMQAFIDQGGWNLQIPLTDVVAIARRKDGNPTRYLVYAMTSKPEVQPRVRVWVPGSRFSLPSGPNGAVPQDPTRGVVVDVAPGGSFFEIIDATSAPSPSPISIAGGALTRTTDDATLTVTTAGAFTAGAVVQADGLALPTSYVSPTTLVADLSGLAPRANHETPYTITVKNVVVEAAPATSNGVGGLRLRAASCFDAWARGATADGVYVLDPDGKGPQPAFDAYCDQQGGGWTLIASQPASTPCPSLDGFGGLATTLMPSPSAAAPAALPYYMTTAIGQSGSELKVVNALGQSHVFKGEHFDQPIDFDQSARYDAGTDINGFDGRTAGVIYGYAQPVLNHYQVELTCTSANCSGDASTGGGTYLWGTPGRPAMVFDWHPGAGEYTVQNPNYHAHFGGKCAIEPGHAARGVALWLRDRRHASRGVRSSCREHFDRGATRDGLYLLNPARFDNPSSAPFFAWCDMETAIDLREAGHGAGPSPRRGWTLIVQQDERFETAAHRLDGDLVLNGPPPTPFGKKGALRYYLEHDLKELATHLRATNDRPASGPDDPESSVVFETQSFAGNGGLVFKTASGAARWDAAYTNYAGLVYGVRPVVNHFQINEADCGGGACAGAAATSATYSPGLMIVFDWSSSASYTRERHAHFGGYGSAMETSYARKGTTLYAY